MKKLLSLILVTASLLPQTTLAESLSASAVEMEYAYQASFRSLALVKSEDPDATELAIFHSSHVFGLFHSPLMAKEQVGFPDDLNEGFAGSKDPVVSGAKAFVKPGDPYYWVSYQAHGVAMVLKRLVTTWPEQSEKEYSVQLPLLLDLPKVYLEDLSGFQSSAVKKCTDSEYNQPSDFFYFYDPFQCPFLTSESTEFVFKQRGPWDSGRRFPSKSLLGDNGNGELVVLYFAMGFDGHFKSRDRKSKIKRDDGYRIYSSVLKKFKRDYGFTEIRGKKDLQTQLGGLAKHLHFESPVSSENFSKKRLYKTLVSKAPEKTYLIRLGLFDSQAQSSSSDWESFPRFWKEAWDNGDFIYYGGHSGDGIVLDSDRLLSSLGLDFMGGLLSRSEKVQVGFLDACSSYGYNQDMYAQQRSNLHLMTYGVVSLYHAAEASIFSITDVILSGKAPRWQTVLQRIEEAQLGPHYRYLYGREEGDYFAEQSRAEGLFPSFLLNVWVP